MREHNWTLLFCGLYSTIHWLFMFGDDEKKLSVSWLLCAQAFNNVGLQLKWLFTKKCSAAACTAC